MPVTIQQAPNWNIASSFGEHETVPVMVPAVAEDVFASDTWLREITLTNKSAAAVTVTIADKQDTPREVVAELSIEPHATAVIEFVSRYCPGGVTWVASAADAVIGYMRGRR
jgi:uncharacterized lipoprotein YbaY